MMHSVAWLLADASTTTRFEFGRIQSNSDWWIYAGVLLAILAPLVWIYRRDTAELPWYLRFGLPLLRTLVLVGLLVVYLQPRWRSEREEHLDSRAIVLVDTSLSMGRIDPDTPAGRAGQTRLQQVAGALDDSQFLARLRKKHEVTVVPFNNALEKDRRVVLPLESEKAAGTGANLRAMRRRAAKRMRLLRRRTREPRAGASRLLRRPFGASNWFPAASRPALARPWSNSSARSGTRPFPGSC